MHLWKQNAGQPADGTRTAKRPAKTDRLPSSKKPKPAQQPTRYVSVLIHRHIEIVAHEAGLPGKVQLADVRRGLQERLHHALQRHGGKAASPLYQL